MSAPGKTDAPAAVLDLHAHFFNLNSLPVRGILDRWGVPRLLALAVAKLLLLLTEDEEGPRPPGAALDDRLPELDLDGDIVHEIARDTPAEIFLDDDFLAGLSYLESVDDVAPTGLDEEVARALSVAGGDPAAVVGALRALQLATQPAPLRLDLLERLLRKVARIIEGGVGKLRFLRLLTRSEDRILRAYLREYPGVGSFVHHMMDLGPHYGGDEPRLAFPAGQLRRMLRLAATTNGRMKLFVAFSPYRANGLSIVQECVRLGAAGVKFYPPSGYRATGNTDGVFKDAPPAATLDRRNSALFKWCADERVPLFTHCTPSGFEAGKDYGKASDPDYWCAALEQHPALRLCFGHAGGAQGWFEPNTPDGDARFRASFAGKVVALMRNHEHVYAEFGYLDEVLNQGQLLHLQVRLVQLLQADPRLGDRICYGSDWHMLYQELRSAQYLDAFTHLFSHAALAPYRDRFFRHNAERYLG